MTHYAHQDRSDRCLTGENMHQHAILTHGQILGEKSYPYTYVCLLFFLT